MHPGRASTIIAAMASAVVMSERASQHGTTPCQLLIMEGLGRRRPCLALDSQVSEQHPALGRHDITRILPLLYVGGDGGLCDVQLLQDLGLSTIINCTSSCPNFFPEELTYVRVPVRDEGSEDLLAHLQPALDAMEAARRGGGGVLVHCQAGISRSAAITVAYLLKHCRMSLLDALGLMRRRRPQAAPNPGFVAQLVRLEAELFHGRVTLNADKYEMDRFADIASLSLVESDAANAAAVSKWVEGSASATSCFARGSCTSEAPSSVVASSFAAPVPHFAEWEPGAQWRV